MHVDPYAYEAVQAARESAWWAGSAATAAWMLGLAGLAINVGGLAFIWRQLKVAELNAKAAVDAAHAALLSGRPWLKVTVADDARTTLVTNEGGMKTHLTLTVGVENVGAAPALDIVVNAAGVAGLEWGVGNGNLPPDSPASEPLPLGALTHGSDTTYNFAVPWLETWPDEFVVAVRCEYSVPGLADRRMTALAFQVRPSRDAFISEIKRDGVTYQSTPAFVWRADKHRVFMT